MPLKNKKLNHLLISMWKTLKVIMDENNIRYFAIGGTAIGAFREKGFIPWDDDIDIAVFKEDIPKLKKAILKSNLSFDKNDFVKRFPFYFHKIYDPNSVILENKRKTNLFIDIFVAHPESEFNKFDWKKYRFIEKILFAKSYRWSNNQKILSFGFKISQFLLLPIPFGFLKKQVKKIINRQTQTQNKNIRSLFHNKPNEKYDISKIILLPFEDSEINVISNFPETFKNVFGDIFKRPEEDKRWNHNIEIFD